MHTNLIVFMIAVLIISFCGLIVNAQKANGENIGCTFFLDVCLFAWTIINLVLLCGN